MTLERGSLLNNRYRIADILGQGGMGAVYRAVDDNLGIEVAVKENLFLTEEYARQFRREATILAGLRHPNLPRVGDHFGIENQGQYLVMDYIEGEDLRQRMERIGSLPEEEVVLIGAAICDALAYLHTRRPPVVHRDIKPGNVKITPEGQIVLVDFGLAKLMHESQATTTGARAMTPGYSPPEQYGTARTDPRTDIYSLAATLYAALTGVIPEDGLARATGNADLTPLRKLEPKLSRRVASAIEKGLALHPDDRYQTAEEFKSALLSALSSTRNTRGEITITPPPVTEGGAEVYDADGAIILPSDGRVALFEKPSSRPLARASRPVFHSEKPWQSGSNWLALVILIVLLGSSAVLILTPPGQSSTLLGLLASATVPPTQAQQPGASLTPCAGEDCISPAGLMEETPTRTPSPTGTDLPTETPTATPTASPTALGGGPGEIAFVSNRTGSPQIWIMDINGGKPVQVTNLPDGACQPSWSPDGLRLVFISPCQGKRDIYERTAMYIINRDGTNLAALPASPEGDFDPAWSPDGNRIAFTSLRNGQMRIYLLDLRNNSVLPVSDTPFTDRHPTWSPSGAQLAFVRVRNSAEIWVISDNGQNELRFTQSGTVNNLWPVWSPDGQVIFYTQNTQESAIPWLIGQRYEDRGKMNEFRIPAPGTNQPLGPVVDVSVSPDGFWFVFESWPEGDNHDIYRMTINGSNLQRITTDPDFDFQPAWNPAKP